MKPRSLLALVATLLLGAPWTGAQRPAGSTAPAATRGNVAAELELLYARPFVLEQPYVHTWRAEAPQVRSGYVLVLRGALERLRRRQVHEPVLYVGAQTAERVNAPPLAAGEMGQLVVLVPAPLAEDGTVVLDLERTPVFLGTSVLPEEVDAEHVARELTLAQRRGAGPARPPRSSACEVLPIRREPLLQLPDRHALQLELAALIEFYSPLEVDLVRGLRVPIHR